MEELAGARAIYDQRLGYVPKPGRRVTDFTATIGEDSLRQHGETRLFSEPKIVVVGDSYTFGDGVDDDETWPAYLQLRMKQTVLNGGVFGYGLDQTTLRAESLLDKYQPRILIISMIADDLERNELSYRFAWKPYFDIVDGKLKLQNIPVPKLPPPVRYRSARDILSYSYFANALFRRLAPTWWQFEGAEQRVHRMGAEVAGLLMRRIEDKVRDRNIRVVVVAQCDRSMDTTSLKPVLQQAVDAGLETLDLATPLADLIKTNPHLEDVMFLGPFAGHMTADGNRWIAKKIAEKLDQTGGAERDTARSFEQSIR